MSIGDVVAFAVLLVVLAAFAGVCLLLIRLSWRLTAGPSRPAAPRPRPQWPPDDSDDEEYSARHHH